MFSSPVHETYYGSKRSGADIEEKMAREIQRMKLENEAKTREVEKICAESEEIRQLKEKIRAAYVSKERAAQISENQIRKIEDIKRDAEIDDIVLRHNYEEWQREQARETERKMKQLSGKDVIKQQIDEKKAKGEEAYREYLKEKGQVEAIVNKIIDEDMKKMADDQNKKKQNFQNMVETLEEKRLRLIREKEQEKADNKRYLEFYQQKEKQAEDIRAKKLELEAAKDQIFQKLKAEQEAQLREKEMLEDLRMQLHLEEFDATERFKDRMERQKKQSQKEQMQEAEREAHALKQAKKQEEERMEKEYRRMMLEKFALDDKLEQMSMQKRRMKELEHKKEVEKLWQDRLEVYRAEREKEAWEHQRKIEEEKIRADIIKRERERLLKEHMPNIAEFMPKGTVEKPEEYAYATRGGFNNTNNSNNRYGY